MYDGPNQSVDLDAAPNQLIDPSAGPNQSVDPSAVPNQSIDPDAGPPNMVTVKKSDGPGKLVYLGLSDVSRPAESAALADDPNAVIVPPASTDPEMKNKIMSTDGKTKLDLTKEEDVQKFLSETGVDKRKVDENGKPLETQEEAAKRMENMQDLFLGSKNKDGVRQADGIDPAARAQTANFVQTLQSVEQGDMNMDRLVISGHNATGDKFYNEAGAQGGVSYKQMNELMSQFPQAQGGVQDLMMSACHTLDGAYGTAGGAAYRKMFPNLESAWGYNGQSPGSVGKSSHTSATAVKKFAEASEGNDPEMIKQAAKEEGARATTVTYPPRLDVAVKRE
jgi:hypothetical protein